MGLRTPIRTAFYEGSGGTSSLVPKVWDCAIGGRTYMFDTKYFETGQFRRSSIPLLKPQQAEGTVNEDALNPADGARAKVESWHHGAGQTFLDRPESNPYRFRSSKGIDPWTRWKIRLLHDTASKRASVNTNLAVITADTYLYVADGNDVLHTTSLSGTPTWASADIHAGDVAQSVKSITSDGYYVYAALGSNGIHRTVNGATSSAHYSDLSATLIGYAKGRLMAANGNAIYNVIASGAAPSALYTHPNTDFSWVGFAEGLGNVYAAGYSGDKSLVYRTAVKADGTALDVPVVAGRLPDGEIVRSISSYLGLILIGTDRGWWVASQDSNGDLELNKVQETDEAVRCFEGQGDFIWYGWTDFDATSTGLGRADLRSDTKGASVVTPAYASDLMATTQGDVVSVATFGTDTVFAISGVGVYAQTEDLVASGTIDSGLLTHGMPDAKVALTVTVTHEPLNGEVSVAIAPDGGDFDTRGTNAEEGSTSLTVSAGSVRAEAFELRHTLERDAASTTEGPVVTRSTLESNLAPGRGRVFNVALIFADQLVLANGTDKSFDCATEYASIETLLDDGGLTTYQDCLGAETVTLEDADFLATGFTKNRDAFKGTYLLKFRRGRRRTS